MDQMSQQNGDVLPVAGQQPSNAMLKLATAHSPCVPVKHRATTARGSSTGAAIGHEGALGTGVAAVLQSGKVGQSGNAVARGERQSTAIMKSRGCSAPPALASPP